MLDRNDPVPLYYRTYSELKERISSGLYEVGAQIPIETELCDEFRVSRITIRKALDELVREGLIIRIPGRGTFVNRPKIARSSEQLLSLSEHAGRLGLQTETKVVRFEEATAGNTAARRLRIAPDELIYDFVRLRRVEGVPLVIEHMRVPHKTCPGLTREDLKQSVFHVFIDKYKLSVSETEEIIEAVSVNRQEAKLLEVEEKSPALLLDGLIKDGKGHPISWFIALYRGDRFRLTTRAVDLSLYESDGVGRQW